MPRTPVRPESAIFSKEAISSTPVPIEHNHAANISTVSQSQSTIREAASGHTRLTQSADSTESEPRRLIQPSIAPSTFGFRLKKYIERIMTSDNLFGAVLFYPVFGMIFYLILLFHLILIMLFSPNPLVAGVTSGAGRLLFWTTLMVGGIGVISLCASCLRHTNDSNVNLMGYHTMCWNIPIIYILVAKQTNI